MEKKFIIKEPEFFLAQAAGKWAKVQPVDWAAAEQENAHAAKFGSAGEKKDLSPLPLAK